MGRFIIRRLGVMILTAICLTYIVFFLTNLYPNLEKVAKFEGNMRMTDEQVVSWLGKNGYLRPDVIKYGEWLGVVPGFRHTDAEGGVSGRCISYNVPVEAAPTFCGVLQGDWGNSSVFQEPVWDIVWKRLGLTGNLMLAVLLVMVPSALIVGIFAGMKEGSRTDRSLSTVSILSTATP